MKSSKAVERFSYQKRRYLELLLLLTAQLNLFWSNVEAKYLPKPTTRIVEIHSFISTKLEVKEGQRIVNKKPDSNLIIGEDVDVGSKIVLECEAVYPVQWVYQGTGMPEYSTNTSTSKTEIRNGKTKFMSSASLGFQRNLGSYDSGRYTCRSLQDPNLSAYYQLYVRDYNDRVGNIFQNKEGDTIVLRGNDRFVRIPCIVTNPKAAVSLQKSVNGFIKCPLNDSISFDPSEGFNIQIQRGINPIGTYVCTAGLNGTYEVVEYTVIPEPEKLSSCEKNSDCATHEACIREESVKRCSSPCTDLCGKNTQCNTINHIPKCRCLRGYSGNPYRGCYATQGNRDVCSPNPCGVNAECRNNYGVAKCTCRSGYYGDPYSRCYFHQQTQSPQRDPCSRNPCGPYSTCSVRNNYVSCKCKAGYVGQPPYCRPECTSDYNCDYMSICYAYKCRNACQGACPGARCKVYNRQPVCSYQLDCYDCKRDAVPASEDEMKVYGKSPCNPSPCGEGAQCMPTVEKNSLINITTVVAYCECPEKMKGDPYNGCNKNPDTIEVESSDVQEIGNQSITESDVGLEKGGCLTPCGKNAVCFLDKNECKCQPNYQGNPYTECSRLNCTSAEDCDVPGSSCVMNECVEENVENISPVESPSSNSVELGATLCGSNAVGIVTPTNEVMCSCPEGFTGRPNYECHKIT